MSTISKLVAFVAAFGFSTAAIADTGIATISNTTGKVLVNQGKGYFLVSGALNLNVGDQVMVGDKSTASIDYDKAKCHVTVNAKTVIVISSKPACKAGQDVAQAESVMIEPAKAMIPPSPQPVFPPSVLIVGGLSLSGIVYLTVASKP